ncbi:Chromosome transmission fidelity protein 18 [Rhizophlyctis rosea]|uniref:Chromosome transmission fidelity protein 18 n=1 Tax=Rhizophlyctis rosea TaxID=64517 RepID=A0AAD5S6N1_9FUNG|nr:Chromosome transmission fidelity protein 18 [Rhizophlyctis rosea]
MSYNFEPPVPSEQSETTVLNGGLGTEGRPAADLENVNHSASLTPESLAAQGWDLERNEGKYYVHPSGWCYGPEYGYFYLGEDGQPVWASQAFTDLIPKPTEGLPPPGTADISWTVPNTPYTEPQSTPAYSYPLLPQSYPTYADPEIYTYDFNLPTPSGYEIPTSDLEMKLIVLRTSLPHLLPGSIIPIDGSGLTIGRDRSYEKRLRLNEMAVSRYHCNIFVDQSGKAGKRGVRTDELEEGEVDEGVKDGDGDGDRECFFVVDAGSTQGTFVNGVRLSDPKKSSKPHPLHHLDTLTIGSTELEVHHHSNLYNSSFYTSCDACQISNHTLVDTDTMKLAAPVVQGAAEGVMTSKDRKDKLERERKEELRRLKRVVLGRDERGGGGGGMKKRKGRGVSVKEVLGTDVGKKDMRRGLFGVLDEVFRTRTEKERRGIGGGGENDDTTKYVTRLTDAVNASGEYDKIMQGCYETYLRTKIFDTSSTVGKTKIEKACGWMEFWDQLDAGMWKRGHHELGVYLAYPIVSFHGNFASARRVEVEFPRVQHEMTTRTAANRNVLMSLASGMPAGVRGNWSNAEGLVVELVTYLLKILSPELRPVNIQLVKPAERVVLDRLVEVMVTFGIRFMQEKGDDGQYAYKLDPPIDTLMKGLATGLSTGTSNSKRVLNAPYAVRQLIAQEIDKEHLRRAEAASVARAPPKKLKDGAEMVMDGDGGEGKEVVPVPKPEVQRKPKPIALKEEIKAERDFFGRLISERSGGDVQMDGGEATGGNTKPGRLKKSDTSKIVFKFNEGFSNAVRKPVYVRDFL